MSLKHALKEIEDFSPQHIEMLRSTVAKGATDEQLRLFLLVAQRSGLDPFSRQIHFVKRGMSGMIQTGIDGYRAIASRTGQHAGTDDALFIDESGFPKSATVTVYRMIGGERCPFTATARWEEYKQEYNGKLVGLWEKMPFQMLAKCAESLALRKAFPNELSGLYTHEEMAQADREPVRPITSIPSVQDESTDPAEDKVNIAQTLKELGESPETTADYQRIVKEKTQLDLIPDNYTEIAERLRILLEERKARNG